MKKFIAILISFCLLEVTAMGQGFAPSIPVAAVAQHNISSKINPLLNYSTVSSFNDTGSPFSIVIIQDLHCHPGVQQNISTILSQLCENYNVKNVFVEGASGDLNTQWLSSIEDKVFADKAADTLLSDGKLTGSEYFAYKNNKQNLLKGIEDKDIHLQNLQRLASIVESRHDIEIVLANAEKNLNKVQQDNYSVFNKKLNRLYGQYKTGKIDSYKYYKKLLAYVRASQKKDGVFNNIKVNMAQYSDIVEYLDLNSRRNKINFKTASSQISSVINELKNTISYNRYNQLVQRTDSFKNTDILLEELLAFEKDNTINLDKYKDLARFAKNRNASKYMNPVKMLASEKKLLKSLQLAGSLTEKEAFIVVLSDLFDNYKDYYTANLSSDGYAYLKSFGIKKYQNFFSDNISAEHIGELDKYYDLLSEYYETNISRDKIFTKFIDEKLPVVKKSAIDVSQSKDYQLILDNSKELNVVVCGGFHSSGLEKEFKERNISYLVITPKVEGDFKIAATLYENILLSSVDPSKYSIALQMLSQAGQNSQFKAIVESMLTNELSQNANLNVQEFLNDTLNKICDINKEELEQSGIKNYMKPNNEGVTVNEDGTFTLNISFEGNSEPEQISISTPISYEGSIYGHRFSKTSPFWEWIYVMPFSSFIMGSKAFKFLLHKTFLSKLSVKNVNSAMKYKKSMKVIDAVTSTFAFASFFINPFLFVFSSIVYVLARSMIFTSSHVNAFNVKNNDLKIMVNLFSGVVYAAPFVLSVFGVFGLIAAFAISIGMHSLYNWMIAPVITYIKKNNYAFTDSDIMRYFYNYEKRLLKTDISKGFSFVEKIKFSLMLEALKMNKNKKISNRIIPYLIRIATLLSSRKKAGDMVLDINKAVALKIKDANEKVSEFIDKSESDQYSFWFLHILSHKDNREELESIIFDTAANIKFRLYAYAVLRDNYKWDLAAFQKQQLLDGAKTLIKNFSWEKDLAHLVDSGKWAYNAELQSYITAVYMIMSLDDSGFTGTESYRMYRKIIKARFDGQYMNADSSLAFGKDLFKRKDLQLIFPEIVAHELAHISLYDINFSTFRKILIYFFFLPDDFRENSQRVAVHELFSDIAAYKLALSVGRSPHTYMAAFSKNYEEKTFLAFSEPHLASRNQLLDFMKLLEANGFGFDIDTFSSILKKKIRKNTNNNKFQFEDFFFEVAKEYLSHKNILVSSSEQEGKGISLKQLQDICKPLVINKNNSALWEWVYMLPGVTYITRSKIFSKFISNVIMKGKSEELKRKKLQQLRSNRAVRLLDITGSAIFITSLFCGGGIIALAVYFITRAVIFSYAHKNYTLKVDRKDKLKLAGVFLAFSLPAILILAFGGFGVSAIALSLAVGIPSNLILHNVYNQYKSRIGFLKKFPKASILEDSQNTQNSMFNYSYAEIIMPAKEYIKQHNIFQSGYDDRINPANRSVIEILKSKLSDRFNVLPDDIIIINMHLMSSGDILKTSKPLLYSFDEVDGKYLLRVENYLLNILREDEIFAEKFTNLLELDSIIAGRVVNSEFHITTAFEVKRQLLKKRLIIPQHSEVSYAASRMLRSDYGFADTNQAILKYISDGIKIKPEYAQYKELLEYQLFEMMGYVLQSQTWLSPSADNMQYGYFQKKGMPASNDNYERQLASTESFEVIFETVFSNHSFSQILKSKEAALYEYFKKRTNIASSFLIPQSLSGQFEHISMTGSEHSIYSFLDAEEFRVHLNEARSRKKIAQYHVIDCSQSDELEEIVSVIKEYNSSVVLAKRIKEVMFYNAKIEDYKIAINFHELQTEFIFDISTLMDIEQSKYITQLFTRVPAVYTTNESVTTDYGSRLDNFTITYLRMLIMGVESSSLDVKKDQSNQKRLSSSNPDANRVNESIHYYEDLVSDLSEMTYFDGMRGVVVKIVSTFAKESLAILKNKDSSVYDVNVAIDEYRTLLNHMLYLKWSDIKDSRYGIETEAKEKLAAIYNLTMRKPVDSFGNKFSQETLLVTSGMSALTTISALLSSEGVNRISLGQNLYYENIQMFQDMGAIENKDIFFEFRYEDVLRSLKTGTEAMFIDLVSNSVSSPDFMTEDIVVADIKKIVTELSGNKFVKPFYLCIDNSMYPAFELADIFDGMVLPDNLNIIVYGSMQKLHQRGLEINTAGFLTLISNGFKHEENMSKLKEAAVLTSSEIDSFRYVSLQEFLHRNNNLQERTQRLNRNAEEIAAIADEAAALFGGEFKILHSSQYSGSQKAAWENNHKPQIPFLFIRDKKARSKISLILNKFITFLNDEDFYDFIERDSYGFSFLTAIFYSDDILRFNIGDYSQEQKNKIARAMIKTFAYNSGTVSVNAAFIDHIYELLNTYNIDNIKINDNVAVNILSFISDDRILKSLSYGQVLKAFIVCEKMGEAVPDNIISHIQEIVKDSADKISDEEKSLLAETFKYVRGMSAKEIIDESSVMWLSGEPKTEGAAAVNLIEMLLPGKTYTCDPDKLMPTMLNKQSTGSLLRAA